MARISFPLNGQFVIHSCDIMKKRTYLRFFLLNFYFHICIFFFIFISPIQKMLLKFFIFDLSRYRLKWCRKYVFNRVYIYIYNIFLYCVSSFFFKMNFHAKISLAIYMIRIQEKYEMTRFFLYFIIEVKITVIETLFDDDNFSLHLREVCL